MDYILEHIENHGLPPARGQLYYVSGKAEHQRQLCDHMVKYGTRDDPDDGKVVE